MASCSWEFKVAKTGLHNGCGMITMTGLKFALCHHDCWLLGGTSKSIDYVPIQRPALTQSRLQAVIKPKLIHSV